MAYVTCSDGKTLEVKEDARKVSTLVAHCIANGAKIVELQLGDESRYLNIDHIIRFKD